MVAIISLWVFCGVISVMVATSKGQNNFMILVGYSVLGPIGLLHIFMKKRKTKLYCPYCEEHVDEDNGHCSLCGLDLSAAESTGESFPGRQCPRCSESGVHDAYIEDGSWGKWCPQCKMSIKKIRKNLS
jgi:hypothetical protein